MKRNILITGTSTGIGQSCVSYLAKKDYTVFAGVRNESDFSKFDIQKHKNIIPVILDINKEDHLENTYQEIYSHVANDGLQGLVNNAAIGIAGPLEFASPRQIADQFNTNVISQIRLIQKILPLLRTGGGRIINMGSTNGFISYPYMAIYSATKFALEALSDALRIELKPFNIPVILINPDKISTPIWQKSIKLSEQCFDKLADEDREMYENNYRNFLKAVLKIEKSSSSPDIVAQMVDRALSHSKPKRRYLPGFDAKATFLISKLIPKRILDKLIIKELGV